MTRAGTAAVILASLCHASAAGEISSAYTDIDAETTCSTFAIDAEDGEFRSLVCSGWQGYPVLIFAGDLRESVFYGFPPEGELPWESFSAFNSSGPRIEWRIETDGSRSLPFAAIHRRFVSADPEDPAKQTEVLVVAKVGQVEKRGGCTVGLVLATGNPQANEEARRIADERARNFACGADQPVMVGNPMPDFSRSGN